MTQQNSTVWRGSSTPKFGVLESSIKADVVVIGGGVTGLVTTHLLRKTGASVILLEKNTIGAGESGSTTAHLTVQTDEPLSALADGFGIEHAVASWDAAADAIEAIHHITHAEEIDCNFEWVPGFLTESIAGAGLDEKQLKRETELSYEQGFAATFVSQDPIFHKHAMRLDRQAKFHPMRFLNGLAARLEQRGRCIFDTTEVTDFSPESKTITAGGHRIDCDTVVMATHVPLQGRSSTVAAGLFQTKLYPYTSYVVRAKLRDAASTDEALFWDTTDPYYYLRIDRDTDGVFAIFGGCDRKTGQEKDASTLFRDLEQQLKTRVSVDQFTHRWAGQVIETNDGLPFIGEVDHKQFIATGYAGNGFTYGVAAARIISDAIAGRKNPWADLFHPERTRVKAGAWDYLKENLDYPYYMAKRLLTRGREAGISALAPGEGGIFHIDHKRVAACRTRNGTVCTLEPEFTHLGCLVRWNSELESWDCPCHGSRFTADGQVLGGPAEKPLKSISVGTGRE